MILKQIYIFTVSSFSVEHLPFDQPTPLFPLSARPLGSAQETLKLPHYPWFILLAIAEHQNMGQGSCVAIARGSK